MGGRSVRQPAVGLARVCLGFGPEALRAEARRRADDISQREVFGLCCEALAISQGLGHFYHTVIVVVPANVAFTWNRRFFNVAVS
eukprot:11163684-Lingulodinium_polyedra.AAC.1